MLPEMKFVVKVDSPGRYRTEHVGEREEAERLKDEAIRRSGWKVVRVRLSGLPPLDSADVNVCLKHGFTKTGGEQLKQEIEALSTIMHH